MSKLTHNDRAAFAKHGITDEQVIARLSRVGLNARSIKALEKHRFDLPRKVPPYGRTWDHYFAGRLQPMVECAELLKPGELSTTLRREIQRALDQDREMLLDFGSIGVPMVIEFNTYAGAVEHDPAYRTNLRRVLTALTAACEAHPTALADPPHYTQVFVATLPLLTDPAHLLTLFRYLVRVITESYGDENLRLRELTVPGLAAAIRGAIPADWFFASLTK